MRAAFGRSGPRGSVLLSAMARLWKSAFPAGSGTASRLAGALPGEEGLEDVFIRRVPKVGAGRFGLRVRGGRAGGALLKV